MTELYLRDNIYIPYPAYQDLSGAKQYIDNAFELLQPLINDKDEINLWCTGTSGIFLATLLMCKFDLNVHNVALCYIRKEDDNCHDAHNKMCFHYNGLNIAIDDLVDTCATIYRLNENCEIKTEKNIDILIVYTGCYRKNIWKLIFKPDVVIMSKPYHVRYDKF